MYMCIFPLSIRKILTLYGKHLLGSAWLVLQEAVLCKLRRVGSQPLWVISALGLSLQHWWCGRCPCGSKMTSHCQTSHLHFQAVLERTKKMGFPLDHQSWNFSRNPQPTPTYVSLARTIVGQWGIQKACAGQVLVREECFPDTELYSLDMEGERRVPVGR